MITGFLINAFYILFYNILNVFSTGSLPAGVSSAITTMATYIAAWSFFVNVTALSGAIQLVFGFELTMLTVKFVLWLVRTIRGSGS